MKRIFFFTFTVIFFSASLYCGPSIEIDGHKYEWKVFNKSPQPFQVLLVDNFLQHFSALDAFPVENKNKLLLLANPSIEYEIRDDLWEVICEEEAQEREIKQKNDFLESLAKKIADKTLSETDLSIELENQFGDTSLMPELKSLIKQTETKAAEEKLKKEQVEKAEFYKNLKNDFFSGKKSEEDIKQALINKKEDPSQLSNIKKDVTKMAIEKLEANDLDSEQFRDLLNRNILEDKGKGSTLRKSIEKMIKNSKEKSLAKNKASEFEKIMKKQALKEFKDKISKNPTNLTKEDIKTFCKLFDCNKKDLLNAAKEASLSNQNLKYINKTIEEAFATIFNSLWFKAGLAAATFVSIFIVSKILKARFSKKNSSKNINQKTKINTKKNS